MSTELMNLSKKDVQYLYSIGCLARDIEQIDEFLPKTKYYYPTYDKTVTAEEARRLLGDKVFLSGLNRSVFHGTAIRNAGGNHVGFETMRI